jgi:hypothetical protein
MTNNTPLTFTPETPDQGDIKLIEEFDAAALWMALPRKQREPATQLELADKLGIHSDSITDWKKRDDSWEKVNDYRQYWVKDEISDLVNGLIKKARQGTAAEVKLFLQFAGLYTETSRQELTGKDGNPIQFQSLADLVVGAAQSHDSNPPTDTAGDTDLANQS